MSLFLSLRQWSLTKVRNYTCRSGFAFRLYNSLKFRELGFKGRSIHVSRAGALGDVIMCTPALRALKDKYPFHELHFYTKFPELVRNLKFIDHVHYVQDEPEWARPLQYETVTPLMRPIPEVFGDIIGVQVLDITPEINPELGKSFNIALPDKQLVRRIVINRCASKWTPNKDWQTSKWSALISKLVSEFQVVDIGSPDSDNLMIRSPRYIDLRGKTDLNDLVGVIQSAAIHVGPVSGPVHIAAACRVPSVVIYGGYEDPKCSSYPGNINLYSDIECSNCWLRTPCPYGKRCLEMISVNSVHGAIHSVLVKI